MGRMQRTERWGKGAVKHKFLASVREAEEFLRKEIGKNGIEHTRKKSKYEGKEQK